MACARPVRAPDVGEKERDSGELFGVPRELSGKNAEELVEDWPGKNELVLLGDDAQQRLFTPAAGEHQRGDEHVGVEHDLHSLR